MGGEINSTPDASSEYFKRVKAKISKQKLPSFFSFFSLVRSA